jgi:photosystem II stability/assembly factor-like uncharacterized protein
MQPRRVSMGNVGGGVHSRRSGWLLLPPVLAAAWTALAWTVAPAAAGTNVWTSLGPSGGLVSTVAVDPADPQVVYAGSVGGVFKSLDGGASWQAASRGLKIQPIAALAVDPLQRGTVYAAAGDAGTYEVGVFVSRDGAATWSTGFSFGNGYARDGGEELFSSLAVDPAHPGTAFAASNMAIYVTHDSGQTWLIAKDYGQINPIEGLTVQVVADPARRSVFAHVFGRNAFRDPPYVQLLESSDAGATWSDHAAALPAAQPGRLAIEPTPPGILYLQTMGRIFRSLDGAASWQEALAASSPIAAGPGGLVIAGWAGTGAVRSTDGGRNWELITAPGLDRLTSYAFGASADQIYASGNALGVVASGDGGQSWQPANHGLTATSVAAVTIDPARSARIYTALADMDRAQGSSALFKSRNFGGRWRPIGAAYLGFAGVDTPDDPESLFVDPANPSALLYTAPLFAAKSADGGASWTPLPTTTRCLSTQFLTPVPSSPSVLFAPGSCSADPACGASKSVDGGATWSCVHLANVFRIVVAPSDGSVVYAIANLRTVPSQPVLWRSDDGGASWSPLHAGAPFEASPTDYVPSMAVDPSDARRLFVGAPTGIWRSLDGGDHWSRKDRGLPFATLGRFPFAPPPLLAVDPQNPQLVYAGASFFGVYRSLDGGGHWQPILAGLPPLNPFIGADFYQGLTPDPRRSGTVYLGTWGNGLLTFTAE